MARKVYLISASIILLIIFAVTILPYIVEYISFLKSMKSFDVGANIIYSGHINLWAIHRGQHGVVDYEAGADLRYVLNISYRRDGIYASLTIYNSSSSRPLFNKTVRVDRGSSLLQFIIPRSSYVDFRGYGYKLSICPYPGPIRFGSFMGSPSEVGVPREYLGVLSLQNGSFIVTDQWWYNDWGGKCKSIVPRYDTGTFFRYGRIENGYMLLSYTAYYGGTIGVGNPDIVRVFRGQGSPLINMLIECFDIDFLRRLIDSIRSNETLSIELVRETMHIRSSNVYPEDQCWLEGVAGAYMSLTPLSQLLTVAAIAMLILYVRRR